MPSIGHEQKVIRRAPSFSVGNIHIRVCCLKSTPVSIMPYNTMPPSPQPNPRPQGVLELESSAQPSLQRTSRQNLKSEQQDSPQDVDVVMSTSPLQPSGSEQALRSGNMSYQSHPQPELNAGNVRAMAHDLPRDDVSPYGNAPIPFGRPYDSHRPNLSEVERLIQTPATPSTVEAPPVRRNVSNTLLGTHYQQPMLQGYHHRRTESLRPATAEAVRSRQQFDDRVAASTPGSSTPGSSTPDIGAAGSAQRRAKDLNVLSVPKPPKEPLPATSPSLHDWAIHSPLAHLGPGHPHFTTLSRYLAGRYPLPLPDALAQRIPSHLDPTTRMTRADLLLRSGSDMRSYLTPWITDRIAPLSPAGTCGLLSWVDIEPDLARQWRLYWAIYDACEAGMVYGRRQQLHESNANRARAHVGGFGADFDLYHLGTDFGALG